MKVYLVLLFVLGVVCAAENVPATLEAGLDPVTFYVYRAEASSSAWHTHMNNVDTANEDGVLGYLHTEVIPLDMGSGEPFCTRKWGIDLIMKFEVTVLNPPPLNTPPDCCYLAFDGGKCTVPDCQDILKQKGNYVGYQTLSGNPRHAYKDGQWYSFPEGGMCDYPTGSHDCTFSTRLIGSLKIDDLVNADKPEIEPDYRSFCEAGGIEFERQNRTIPWACDTVKSVDFWKNPCDEALCASRVTQLKQANFNTSLPNGCDTSEGGGLNYKNTCVKTCPSGYYEDWDYVCQECSSVFDGCAVCKKAESPKGKSTGCKACGTKMPFLYDGACHDSCPSGMYEKTNTTCASCDESCSVCTGPEKCSDGSGSSNKLYIYIAGGAAAFFILAGVGCWHRRRKSEEASEPLL